MAFETAVQSEMVRQCGAVGLFLDIVALLTLEPGTVPYVVAFINLPGLVVITLLAEYILRKCANYT